MKVLVSSTNSSSHVLWDNLLINLGLGNLYVCTDAIDTKNILLSKGLLPSQILSTEQPFYSLARIVLDYESSAKNLPRTSGLSAEEYHRCHLVFGLFAHQCSRLIVGSAPVYDLMDIYFLCIKYWLNILDTEEIGFIFFSQVPHTGGDFCLYVASTIRQHIRVLNGHPISRSVLFLKTALPLDSHISTRSANPSTCKHDLIKSKLFESLLNHVTQRSNPKPLVVERKLLNILSQLPQNKLLVNGSRPDNYFVLFLGSEPEAACNPNGYPFLTSMQAIDYLLTKLPDDAVLVLREHPVMLGGEKSFAWQNESSYRRVRGESFHRILLSDPRVFYAFPDLNLHDEIERSNGTISISGDIVYESLGAHQRHLDLSTLDPLN